MHEPAEDPSTHWPVAARALWRRLQAHALDDPQAALPFTHRLARDNHLSLSHARRVVEEYRRFCFLACVGETPVTPSDQVDQAWHLYLLYSRDYWGVFTDEVLRRPLHHGPTLGGRDEAKRYDDQYGRTRHAYLQWFARHPPADIWPCARERFSHDTRWVRVNRDDYWLVPRDLLQRRAPALVRAASMLALFALLTFAALDVLAAGAADSADLRPRTLADALRDPYGLAAGPFLWFFGLTSTGAIVLCALSARARSRARGHGRGRALATPDVYTTAEICGGPERVLLTALASLVDAGHVTVSNAGIIRAMTPSPAGAHRLEQAIHRAADTSADFSGADLLARRGAGIQPDLDDIHASVLRQDLVLGKHERPRAKMIVALLLPITLATPRIAVALPADRPVGLLIVLTLAAIIGGAIIVARSATHLTEGGLRIKAQAVARAAALHKRRRSLQGQDLLYGAAVLGGALLTGTVLADVRQAMPAAQGGSGGDGSGEGSGCGGGGCGGCGG